MAGPSGSGKTHLVATTGLPAVALDDFYRERHEPDLPRLPGGGVDWDDPASWNAAAATTALARLCRTASVEVPAYSFAENRAIGHRTIDRAGSPIVLAEGIFAADLAAPLRDLGLLADTLLISDGRWITFVRRLRRDLRERREPPPTLVRQGLAKTCSQAAVVARLTALGAHPVTKDEARARIGELVGPVGIEPTAKGL